MTSDEMARGYLLRAARVLGEAQGHFQTGAWNLVVRRCQETVELALKGVLRAAGVEVPRIHDVGVLLKSHRERIGGRLVEELDRVVSLSRRLRQEREVSFYGDEEVGVPAEELYTRDDAADALDETRFVLSLCQENLG